jgi:exopolyphosphatase/guanosine-5'-triphosphate,3'-diphosphate pyrophosphatase
VERLRRAPSVARLQIQGLDPARADVIDAGALILQRVAAACAAHEVVVSDRGIRWGLLHERIAALGLG